ncbi:MAG: cyclic pyranopterin monophosphate synthase MoaC [bacterium]|nr:cyclic pyranopterin monophosphate synthase MoaC [bacterium]
MMAEFSHYSEDGTSVMVDISDKKITTRTAKAAGFVAMAQETLDLIEKRLLPKGNLFEVAKVAGIMAAKKNSDLIPMCHPLLLSYVDVSLAVNRERGGINIGSEIRLEGKTGAEMEALTAVSVAALTVYDMCKAVDKNMVIEDMKLLEKRGGKSDYQLQE